MHRAPEQPSVHEEIVPTRLSHAVFTAKVLAHRVLRGMRDLGRGPRRLNKVDAANAPVMAGESRSLLWSDPRAAERNFEFGKVHNLRRAVAALDGTFIPAGAEFSFWKQVGRASRRRGYVTGRMLQQGCVVPAMGGGLCQLSNALYDVALQAGCEITERHGHSRIVEGSAAEMGRDATIAWNYVDFRFRTPVPMVLDAKLSGDSLIVRLRAREETVPRAAAARADVTVIHAESCGTCDKSDCFRHEGNAPHAVGRTAYLLDECTPEFRDYVRATHTKDDVLGIPIDGARFRAPRYAWDTAGFSRIGSATAATLWRSFTSRRLKEQGAERRRAELDSAERLAKRLSRLLAPEVTSAIVAQSLLPFLWRDGHLGGRRFTVLATRLPMQMLQERLDRAASTHRERATLSDFRADARLIAAETEAFAAAERIVTPHAEIAALFGARAHHLDWAKPNVSAMVRTPKPDRIAFVGPTVARKGAYEVREAARALDLEVLSLGSELEGSDFWNGVRTIRRAPGESPHALLATVAAVVQPALFEERPRTLLAALAAGIPVIATPGCGLSRQPGLTIIPAVDSARLIAALRNQLRPVETRAAAHLPAAE